MLVLGSTVYLGGDFTSVSGQFRPGFAAVDAVTGGLTQPEMFVLGDTRIYGLATDGAQVFVAGVTFGAPLVGATTIPDTQLTPFGPTGGTVPTSAAFVAGRLYAGLEYDPEAAAPTTSATVWGDVVGDDRGLVHLPAFEGRIDYYDALPGNPPDPPTLTAVATGNRLDVSWNRAATGGAPSSYTLHAGTAPGASEPGVARLPRPDELHRERAERPLLPHRRGPERRRHERAVQRGGDTGRMLRGATGARSAHLHHGRHVGVVGLGRGGNGGGLPGRGGAVAGSADLGSALLPNHTALTVSAPPGLYYVRVRAVNACGIGPVSNEVAVRLDGSVAVPEAPTGLTAGVAGNVVTMAWTPPVSGGTPTGYQVEGGATPGGVDAVAHTAAATLVVPGAPPGTYYLRVRAFNAAGLGSATADLTVVVP